MAKARAARLAGLVMAVLGLVTFGITSPFGLLLCVEKLWERDRPRPLRACDWSGVVLGGLGCAALPLVLAVMWHSIEVGPENVLLYLAFLTGWVWHRVRVVWGRPAASDAEPDDVFGAGRDEQRHRRTKHCS